MVLRPADDVRLGVKTEEERDRRWVTIVFFYFLIKRYVFFLLQASLLYGLPYVGELVLRLLREKEPGGRTILYGAENPPRVSRPGGGICGLQAIPGRLKKINSFCISFSCRSFTVKSQSVFCYN